MPEQFNYCVDLFVQLMKIGKNKKINKTLCINIEGEKEFNIDYKSFEESKKKGISGICRIKNGDDFLEEVLLSSFKLCDEIIIMDNNSTDNTEKIAKQLQKKYPQKIKYYKYPFEITKMMTKDFSTIPSNSIHSFAYFSNYAMSKATYRYIIKIDDDGLFIQSRIEALRKEILSNPQRRYYNCRGINIMIDKENKVGISKSYPYAGLADYGIFPLSSKTFFLHGTTNETLYHPYRWKRFGEIFLHLKLLKKDMGWTNYTNERISNRKNRIEKSGIEYNIEKHLKKITKEETIETLKTYKII
ncbi:MAG: glycosyltransferase family A protein [Candidatus Absconditabacteria bacterium]|nr:glycosyltransferase family A protein [Candidatus Absconditabacteria bacterium]